MLAPVGPGPCVFVVLPVLFGCSAAHEDDFAGGHAAASVGELVFPGGSLRGVPAPTHLVLMTLLGDWSVEVQLGWCGCGFDDDEVAVSGANIGSGTTDGDGHPRGVPLCSVSSYFQLRNVIK